MIDIHSHILPGLDDGSESLEQSVQMLVMARAAGTTDIVATPHANSQFRFDPQQVKDKIADLQDAIGDLPRIHYGCDFHLTSENIDEALRLPAKYSINHRGYLLVEFADTFIPKTTSQIFERMLDAGLFPIVTHPERNPLLQKKLSDVEAWVEMGCFVQVTAQSVLGSFGKRAKAFSDTLLSHGLVHFLASDAHDLQYRPTPLQPAWEYVSEHLGPDTAAVLLEENPGAALVGAPISAPVTAPRKRGWFF